MPRNTFLPAEKQTVVRTLLKDYFLSLTKHLLAERAQLQALHTANQRTLHTRGELSQERKDQLEQHQVVFTNVILSETNETESIETFSFFFKTFIGQHLVLIKYVISFLIAKIFNLYFVIT